MTILTNLLFIFAVVMVFNFIIFIHELGHFWAAKWRGMKVDRFQIWFGKPIWKKTVGGVQYGLGSIPFGGFVSLPQMAPMEAIEGKSLDENEKPLAPISPLDKIIVAFAGPLFSFLLAVACAIVVSKTGLLEAPPNSTQIGYVEAGSPAEQAGLQVGDVITEISGETPVSFDGKFDAVASMIALSSGEEIEIKVKRNGKEIITKSGYTIPEKRNLLERKGLRQIGIAPFELVYIGSVMANSPAELAGLKKGDKLMSINDEPITSFLQVNNLTKGAEEALKYTYEREGEAGSAMIKPEFPDLPEGFDRRLIGITYMPFMRSEIFTSYPSVPDQLKESGTFMWKSIKAVADSKTSVGVEQMSGPIGMGRSMFSIIRSEGGIQRLLWFLVIININLAILNLMPFPVLDGGHIVMAIFEWITRKPVPMKVLEYVQSGFVLLIMSMFLYITLKDTMDFFVPKSEPAQFLPKG